MIKMISSNERPLRLAFKELVTLIEALGWFASSVDNKEYPYNTFYWLMCPNSDDHVNSDEMKKFLYACGYYDIDIDYRQRQIRVNI